MRDVTFVGSARGNLGKASTGGTLEFRTGKETFAFAKWGCKIACSTNTVAEAPALMTALEVLSMTLVVAGEVLSSQT